VPAEGKPALVGPAQPEGLFAGSRSGIGARLDVQQVLAVGAQLARVEDGVRAALPSRQLSVEQVKRLQAALNKVGCHAGPADGAEGAGTQRAIACGLKKYKLASDDLSGLYRKLGLDF